MNWNLHAGKRDGHPTITESTTGVVACGDSWCDGTCGLPALVLKDNGQELRAFGSMVACGSVFQNFRHPWNGTKIEVSLGDMKTRDVLKRFWL